MKTPTLWKISGVALLGLLDFCSAHYPLPVVSSTSSPASETPDPKPKDYTGYYFPAKPEDLPDYLPTVYPSADIKIEIVEIPSDGNETGREEFLRVEFLELTCFPAVISPKDFDKEFGKDFKDFGPSIPDDFKSFFPDDFDFSKILDGFDFSQLPDGFDFKNLSPDDFDFSKLFPDGIDLGFDKFFPPGYYSKGYDTPTSTPPSKEPPKTTLVTVTLPAKPSGSYVYDYAFPKTTSTPSYYY